MPKRKPFKFIGQPENSKKLLFFIPQIVPLPPAMLIHNSPFHHNHSSVDSSIERHNMQESSDIPALPAEVWLKILRIATMASTKEINDPFPNFPHVQNDLYQLSSGKKEGEETRMLYTKRQLVVVCRDWNAWCTPFLYEDIVIGPNPRDRSLMETLQTSLRVAASKACVKVSLPGVHDRNRIGLNLGPLQAAMTMGLGQHVHAITVDAESGKGLPLGHFFRYLLLICQCCPNVTSFSGCWKEPYPPELMVAICNQYKYTLTHLSWQQLHSISSEMASSFLTAPLLVHLPCVRVLDARCFGPNDWHAFKAGKRFGAKVSDHIAHNVEHLYLAATQRSLNLVQLVKFPALTHITVDATKWGHTKKDIASPYPESVIEALAFESWNFLLGSYENKLSYVQIIADTSHPKSWIFALAMISILSTWTVTLPNLTRLEIPLAMTHTAFLNDTRITDPDGPRTSLPLAALQRLDLRVAAPPPYTTRIPKLEYAQEMQQVYGDLCEKRISQGRFPALETVHIVDMSWKELASVFPYVRRFAAVLWGVKAKLFDMDGVELTEEMLGGL